MSEFDFLFQNVPTIFFIDVFLNVMLAFIFGMAISFIYRKTYKGYSYSSTFVTTLIIITMVTSIVIMVIGNNLARAFGLVGAMSIIRFRTALKDTRDIAFVFFSLAAGMAAGAGNHIIGLTGAVIIIFAILFLHWSKYGAMSQKGLMLKFWMIPEDGDEPVYVQVFRKFLSDYTLLNLRSARLGQFLELSFYINFKKKEKTPDFIKELSGLEGIERISMVVNEDAE